MHNQMPPSPPGTGRWRKKWVIVVLAGICLQVFLLNPFFIKKYVVQAYKIPAGSMMPTLLVGDRILVRKGIDPANDVGRGDIIVFQYPLDIRKDFVKRVVGMPGELIAIKDKRLSINGKEVREDYVINSDVRLVALRDNFGPVHVPQNCFFVLGDNRDNSHDSRFWGFVDHSRVKGMVRTIYWSWDRENRTVRWRRIGQAVR